MASLFTPDSRRASATFVGCLTLAVILTPLRSQETDPIAWADAGGGNFGFGTNWVRGKVPGPQDTIRFSLNNTYSVSRMSNFRVAQTFVNNGRVTFRTHNNTPYFAGRLVLGALGSTQFSNSAELRLAGGTRVDSRTLGFAVPQGVVIGADTSLPATFRIDGAGTRFRVVPLSELGLVAAPTGGAVGSDARFTVGTGSRGTVIVSNGGRLESGTSRVGSGSGASGSLVRVTGSGSAWRTSGIITLGVGANANNTRLEVQSGARVSTNGLWVGAGGGNSNAIATFTGDGTEANVAGAVQVGFNSSSGFLNVLDGARLVSTATFIAGTGRHVIGATASDLGIVEVSGAGALWQATGGLEIGRQGTGELVIERGGVVSGTGTFDVAALTSSVGSVRIRDEGSLLETTGLLRIGPGVDGLGEVRVVGGARVQAGELRVGRGDLIVETATALGDLVDLQGGSTNLSSAAELIALVEMTVGENAEVFMVNSTITAPILTNNGRISGTGTLNAGTLINNGTISPGLSPGQLVITGDFVQTPSGVLVIEGGSGEPGEDFDEIVVEGNITLGGTLDLVLPEDFEPEEGASLAFVRSSDPEATLSGGFSQITNAAVSETLSIETGFEAGVVAFEILPKANSDQVLEGTRSGQVDLNANAEIAFPVVLGGVPGRTGELTVSGQGTEVEVAGSLTIGGVGGGRLLVSQGARLSASEPLSVGSTGRLVLQTGEIVAPSVVNAGQLFGEGTLRAPSFLNSGWISPGSSPGLLAFEGDFAQDANGTTTFEIGGPGRGSDYDAIDVEGDVDLNGTFVVVFLDDFAPLAGQSFELLRWTGSSQIAETFEVAAPPAIDGVVLQVVIGEQSLSLAAEQAAPEPIAEPAAPPSAPEPQAPSIASFDSFLLEWPAVQGATHYLVDVATDEAFVQLVDGYDGRDVGSATSIEATDLTPGLYFYRVRAVNQAGPGSFSPTQSVEVSDDPLLLLADFEEPDFSVGVLSGQAGWSVSDNTQGPRRLEVEAGGLAYSLDSASIGGGAAALRSFLSGEASGDPTDLLDAIRSMPALQAGDTLYFSYLYHTAQDAPFHWFALGDSTAAERAMGVFADSVSGNFGLRGRDGSQTSAVLSEIATTDEATRLIVGKLVLNGEGQNDALFANIDPDTLDEPETWDLSMESMDIGAASLNTLVLRSRVTAAGQSFDAIRLGASYAAVLPPAEAPIDLDADSLGVGMPDSWQLLHFGEIGVDPDFDADSDGTSNRFEYYAGTDPRDRESVFQLQLAREGEGTYSVAFPTFADRYYRLWTSQDLIEFETLEIYQGDGSEVTRDLEAIEAPGTHLIGVEFFLRDPEAKE